MLEIVEQRSKEYVMDKAEFQSEVAISKSMDNDGKKYSKTKSVVFQTDVEEGKLHCYMSRGDNPTVITQTDVDEFLAIEYESFDDWSENLFKLYHLTFETDPSNWKNSHCTCPAFASSFMCKHIVCIAYKLGILKPQTNDQMVANTKRGRPKNTTKGLSRE